MRSCEAGVGVWLPTIVLTRSARDARVDVPVMVGSRLKPRIPGRPAEEPRDVALSTKQFRRRDDPRPTSADLGVTARTLGAQLGHPENLSPGWRRNNMTFDVGFSYQEFEPGRCIYPNRQRNGPGRHPALRRDQPRSKDPGVVGTSTVASIAADAAGGGPALSSAASPSGRRWFIRTMPIPTTRIRATPIRIPCTPRQPLWPSHR